MNKRTPHSVKKSVAAISIAVIGLTLVFQQNVLENLFRTNLAKAEVYRGDEGDVLSSLVPSPSCDPNAGQSASSVAVDNNTNYILVWQDDACDGGGNGSGIYYERFNTQTGPDPSSGGPVRVNTTLAGDQTNPSVAMDKVGDYAIVWQGNGSGDADGIYVSVYDNTGAAIASSILVNTSTTGIQSSPKIAMDFDTNSAAGDQGHFVVVWQGEGTGDTDGIYMQRYDISYALGGITPVGSNTLVNTYTTGAQVNPSVAMNNFQETLVTWNGPGTGYPSTDEVWMQGYDSSNSPWGGSANNVRVNSTSPAVTPSVASDKSTEPGTGTVPGGKFVIAYEAGGTDIDAKLVDRCTAAGCPLGNVELNLNASGSNPAVAMDYMGDFTAVWQQTDTSDQNIHAINYDYLGHRVDNAFQVNENIYGDSANDQTNPSIAKDKDGQYGIMWTSLNTSANFDVRLKGYGTDIFKNGAETLAHTPTGTSEYEVTSAIAPNGYRAVAYLGSDSVSGQTRVFYSLYDAGGNIIVQNAKADTVDDSSVDQPSIDFFKDTNGSGTDRFVIVWNGNDPNNAGAGPQVMYREFDSSGTAATATELPVNVAIVGGGVTYSSTQVKAGYYNDTTSSVIDRFAVFYSQNIPTPEEIITGNYHTESGFNPSTLSDCNGPSGNCVFPYNYNGIDLYPDESGNDKIVYTWTEGDVSASFVYRLFGREANGATLSSAGNFTIVPATSIPNEDSDVAFISPTEYIVTWTLCDTTDCNNPSIVAARYAGNFAGSAPTVTDPTFTVYPADSIEATNSYFSRISADANNGSFLIVWTKEYNNSGSREVEGKFYESSPSTANFGVGFVVSTSGQGNQETPSVDMNENGLAIAGWDGGYNGSSDSQGAVFQLLNNPTFVQTLPQLPTSAQLTITQGGKTLTIPSSIEFPAITASTTVDTDVFRQVDENTAPGQPQYFQIEDLGGNSGGSTTCPGNLCYSVTIDSSDFTYDDPSGKTYSIPASNIFIKNYDGDHPGVVDSGTCGTAQATQSFIAPFGDPSDFSLNSSSCDYVPLDSSQTLLDKISNNSDTAEIQFFPEFKITVPALTPPGTYTGTITITSA